MNKLICLVGMCGSGKSVIADELVKRGYGFFRFGQITIDILKERGLEVTEENEKRVREEVRREHGMGAFALLNKPKIEKLLREGNVVGDGLYSWSEYKILKEEYGQRCIIIAVYAPPQLRYARLAARHTDQNDLAVRNRALSPEQAQQRDYAEIENIEKAGPIAMADYTLFNTGTKDELREQLGNVMDMINSSANR